MKLSWLYLMVPLAISAGAATWPNKAYAADGLLNRELIELYQGTNVNPFDVNATNNLALTLIRQGRYERAKKLLSRASRLAPHRQDIKSNEARLSLLLSQMKGLDLDTSQLLTQSFNDQEIEYIPAPWGADPQTEDSKASVVITTEAPEASSSNPFDSGSLVSTANIKLRRGDTRGALRDLQRAKQLSPWMVELDTKIAVLESQLWQGSGGAGGGTGDALNNASPEVFLDDGPPRAWTIEDTAPNAATRN